MSMYTASESSFDLTETADRWPPVGTWTADDLIDRIALDRSEHGLQCAHELLLEFPADVELQLAGLFHDIAHVITSEERHGIVGADIVRPILGRRVASLIELHVPAKRYLVRVDPTYRSILSAGSIATLSRQGGDMTDPEIDTFLANPDHRDALILRRADDRAKVPGRSVPDVAFWAPFVLTSLSH